MELNEKKGLLFLWVKWNESWMNCELPLRSSKRAAGYWLWLFGPSHSINSLFHFPFLVNWLKKGCLSCRLQWKRMGNWTGMELVKLMEWNVKAAEGPPAHNPQPIHKKATHSFKSFQSLNSFTFFVWLVVEELTNKGILTVLYKHEAVSITVLR